MHNGVLPSSWPNLCDLLNQPKPAAADPDGAWYCFERGVSKTEGGQGWADVWMRNHFGWEYKGKHRDLKAAYTQLLQYRESLENPPLLVVSDLDRFEIHTNFTGTEKKVHAFDLAGLAEPKNLDILRRLFTEPESLRPGQTSQSVTEQAAEISRPLLPEGASAASHGTVLGNTDANAGKVPPGRRDLLGTVHYPRIVPKDEQCAKELKKWTRTNLYNQRPAWLDLAHKKLDEAVFAAYGWPTSLTDDELLARLLELNLARGP